MQNAIDTFDAAQIQPQYNIGSNHPVGLFDAVISNTGMKPVKDKPNNGYFEIEYTTPAGKISDRFNLWNDNPQAVDISQKQLSAVCHATGIFRIASFRQSQGAELRNARLKIEVGYQKGQEPSSTNPTGGYTEVKKIFDANGNEPGKAPAGAPQTQLQQGNWNTTQTQPAVANPAPQVQGNNGQWGAPNPNPAAQLAPAAGGWQQNQPQPGATVKPPWG